MIRETERWSRKEGRYGSGWFQNIWGRMLFWKLTNLPCSSCYSYLPHPLGAANILSLLPQGGNVTQWNAGNKRVELLYKFSVLKSQALKEELRFKSISVRTFFFPTHTHTHTHWRTEYSPCVGERMREKRKCSYHWSLREWAMSLKVRLETEATMSPSQRKAQQGRGPSRVQNRELSMCYVFRQMVQSLAGFLPRSFSSTWHLRYQDLWVPAENKAAAIPAPRRDTAAKGFFFGAPSDNPRSWQAHSPHRWDTSTRRREWRCQRPAGNLGIWVRVHLGEQKPARDFKKKGFVKKNKLNRC